MKGPVLLGGLAAAALTVPGLAPERGAQAPATVIVTASGAMPDPKLFTPPAVEIHVGDTVQWNRASGFHNVHFDDGFARPETGASSMWMSFSRTFDTPGTYHYVCDVHAPGMEGTVTVLAATATPTPTPTPPPPPPQLRSLKLVRTSFCTQRSRTCKRPGVVLSIDLSAPATVRGTLRRASLRGKARYKAFGSVDFGQVAAGPRQLRFTRTKTNRRLTPARYRLVLQTAGTTRAFSFRVRR